MNENHDNLRETKMSFGDFLFMVLGMALIVAIIIIVGGLFL